MARGPRRVALRVAGLLAGVALPLLNAGIVGANLPPVPPVPGLPYSGQPITVIVEPPSLFIIDVPPPPTGCVVDMSYDNSDIRPPSTVFRGQTACGSLVYSPVMSGQSQLSNAFSEVVDVAPAYGPWAGSGPFTSEAKFSMHALQVNGVGTSGPVPGLDYTITFTSSITLTYPQTWGPPATGCSVSGETLSCQNSTTYAYIPGTKGGFSP